MARLKTTTVEKFIALADGAPFCRSAKATGMSPGATDHNRIDAAAYSGKRKRDRFWKQVEDFKSIEDRCRQRRGRSWLYRYLNAIFRFHERLKPWQERELVGYFRHHYRLPQGRSGHDVLRILIDLTSRADHKSRSRWAQALRYTYDHRDEWQADKSLRRFFADNGGVAGCAKKIAKPKKKKRSRPIRYWA
jgi:hypothetical protein